MKCTNCGHELIGGSKFCEMCGTPIDDDLTHLAEDAPLSDRQTDPREDLRNSFRDDYRNDSRNIYQDDHRNDFRDDFSDGYNSFRSYENTPLPNDYPPNDYPDPRYDDPRYDDRFMDDRQGYRGDPRYDDRYGAPRNGKPRMSGQKKAIIISVISLVLVVAILGGVIFFVSRNKVSAAELEEAKENYLPPAEAVAIDPTLDDPSNDDIQFKYDNCARISSCSYSVNEKPYDLSFGYNNKNKIIKIKVKYRNNEILIKEIEYDSVSTPNSFEVVDGYYLRLDEQSLCVDSSSSSKETDAPDSTDQNTTIIINPPASGIEKPTEQPTEKPKSTQKPTEKPLEKYKQQYIDFLNSTNISYSCGTLIYLNDDDTPELILWSSGSEVPYYVCFIKNNKVQSSKTADSHSLEYNERGGFFTTGTHDQTGFVYYFDGSSVSKQHTYSFSYAEDRFTIDDEELTQEEYFNEFDSYYLVTERKHDASNDPHDKSSLQDYIRDY